MKSLLLILLAVALVAAACGSGSEGGADGSTDQAVTVPEKDATSSFETQGSADVAVGSSLAFVATSDGGELTFELDPEAQEPTAIEVGSNPDISRSGQVGTDGVATVAYVLWTWDGKEVERSSDIADRLSVKIGEPSDAPPGAVVLPSALNDVLADQPIGARLTALFPAGITGLSGAASATEAHVLVMDILAFQTPEDS